MFIKFLNIFVPLTHATLPHSAAQSRTERQARCCLGSIENAGRNRSQPHCACAWIIGSFSHPWPRGDCKYLLSWLLLRSRLKLKLNLKLLLNLTLPVP